MNLASALIHSVLEFIYPSTCVACDVPLPDGRNKICKGCWDAIPRLTRKHPLYQETRSKLIVEGYVNDLVSCIVFEKEGPFQHIVHALKYKEYKSLGIELGMQIGRLVSQWDINADVIIPVPLHRIKHRERGFNQSEMIAQGIASIMKRPIVGNAIQRTRYTQTQTTLNIAQRESNMKDAFKKTDGAFEKLSGKSCLLVDDIITTGATTNSCAKEILAAGAKSIVVASAALAQ